MLGVETTRPGRGAASVQPKREQPTPRISDRAWVGLVVALSATALVLRLQNLDLSPYGDEAYYYFVTHDLSAWWNTAAYPVSGSTFPVFPLAYHFFAGSLFSLRSINALVGAFAVPLGMLLMRELGVGRALTLISGAFLAIDTILVQFSGIAFLDMLGAVIAMLGLLAYLRGRLTLAAALVAVAVLEKEYYAILGFALAIDQLVARRRMYVQLIVAAIPVLTWLAVRYGIFGAPFNYLVSGHAHAALTVTGIDHALGSIALLPLGVASVVLSPRLRAAALFVLLFLVFQAVWGNAQGWYWCLSVALTTILAAHGAALLLRNRRLPGWTYAAVGALAIVAFSAQAYTTTRYLTTWHGQELNRVAAYLDGQPAQPIDLVACEWPYRYFPLGGPGRPATSLDDWINAGGQLAVACPGAPDAPADWTVVYRSGQYTVLSR